ncbi:PREDICTED: smoothelin-like protein 1 [Gekko japonicus]|uniref:Smoothelin-like protein 1 n=1 Tax=Gekko japonicus TaxID=146911 RepID=A0ABM1L1L2_GEKJA|nr:PREDICTED: smoothelin-like protein 1 [Gekko japonicus]XP_015279849.1 PREDICTED: smoothelin-like protein 1 [Gekko japonicus]
MEAEGIKEQEEVHGSHGAGQPDDLEFGGESEAGKAEAAAGSEAAGGAREAEPAGNVAQGEGEAGKAEAAAGSDAKRENQPAEKALGDEEVQEPGITEKVKGEGETTSQGQAEMEDKVAVSGTEPEEEAYGNQEEVQEKEEKSGDLENNSSMPRIEGRTGSTSDEPLSPEPGEEEEHWPEVSASSPDEGPESPTGFKSLEEDGTISNTTAAETATGQTTSTEAASVGVQEQHPAAEGAATAKEKKMRPAFDQRALTRPRMPPRAQSRKAIVEKFGGAASGPAPNVRRMGGANSVKSMLLEWCRAKTRGYEHVDVQNFSSSWSSGMAFCALIHKFFPDTFDYSTLDPTKRRENFALAFSTAEKLADCAQLLDVEDMVRLSVPDAKCIYTYIQELYRSLVQKGLVKTKKQ